jgi:ATP-dependent DNA ligase
MLRKGGDYMSQYLKQLALNELAIAEKSAQLKEGRKMLKDGIQQELESLSMTNQFTAMHWVLQNMKPSDKSDKFTKTFANLKHDDGSSVFVFHKNKQGKMRCNRLEKLREVALSENVRKTFKKSHDIPAIAKFFADEDVKSSRAVKAWACPIPPKSLSEQALKLVDKMLEESESKELDKFLAEIKNTFELIELQDAKRKFSS